MFVPACVSRRDCCVFSWQRGVATSPRIDVYLYKRFNNKNGYIFLCIGSKGTGKPEKGSNRYT